MAYRKKFYIFEDNGVIAAFNTVTKEWKKSGELNQAHYGHGVIESQGEFIVIGRSKITSYGTVHVEQCTLNNKSIQCKLVEPELKSNWLYPELMLVPSDYCPE